MPRETIYEVVRPSRVLQDDGSWKDEELSKPTVRIEVGWSRDMYVQVATTKLGSNSEPVAVDKDMVPVEPAPDVVASTWPCSPAAIIRGTNALMP